MAKRIMREFRLDKIAAVDRPCQEGALVTIMKRDITQKERDAARKSGKADEEPDPNDPNEGAEGEGEGQGGKPGKGKTMDEAGVKKLQEDLAAMTKRAETAETNLAAEVAKTATLTKAAEIAKTDETFTTEGVVVRKSEVGETSYKVMKAQAERIELNTMEKRAETDIAMLPGETIAKAKVLKAVAGMPEAERTALDVMLKAGNAALVTLSKSTGHGAAVPVDGEAAIEQMAKAYEAAHKVTYAKAYAAVLETPEGREAYGKVNKSLTSARAA